MTEIERYEGSQIVTRRDLRNANTDSWTEVLADIGDLASRIAGTDFVPDSFRGSVPAVAATILTGRELGFAPMTALGSLHSIKGKVGLSAEAMRALVLQAGHEIITTTSTSQQCTMKGRRAGSSDWTEVTWTMADARAAGLLGGKADSGWNKYPRQMLQARASSELCRLAFPDVIRGLASLEEIESYDVLPGAPVAVEGPATSQPAKGAPVKRKARKKAPAPKAEPAAAPDLPEPEQAEPAAVATPSEPPAPDLPDPSLPAEPTDGGAEPTGAVDAPPGDSGEAPAGGEVLDAEIVEEVPLDDAEPHISEGQLRLAQVHFNRLGIKDRDYRLEVTGRLIGRKIDSGKQLTARDAAGLLHVLETSKDQQALNDILEAASQWTDSGEAD